jgi:hypothetical protein
MRTALEQSRLDEPLKFPPVGNFSNRDIGNLGTVIHETARELARVRLTFIRTQQQPHCNENPFYVLPEKGIARPQSPIFTFNLSVSYLYKTKIGPRIFLQQNRQTDHGSI